MYSINSFQGCNVLTLHIPKYTQTSSDGKPDRRQYSSILTSRIVILITIWWLQKYSPFSPPFSTDQQAVFIGVSAVNQIQCKLVECIKMKSYFLHLHITRGTCILLVSK
jgi:hypothetical protein